MSATPAAVGGALDRLPRSHQRGPAEAEGGRPLGRGDHAGVLPLGEDDGGGARLGARPARAGVREGSAPGLGASGGLAAPLRTIAPVGWGTPPRGSTVTAQAWICRASATRSTRSEALPRGSTAKVPADTGLPAAMNQSW